MDNEIALPGGNVGGAVRVGDTVRRATGPWTPAVHALLNYLADAGLTGIPRVLGFDDRGREILEYLPGTSYGEEVPDDVLADGDAVAGRVPPRRRVVPARGRDRLADEPGRTRGQIRSSACTTTVGTTGSAPRPGSAA